MANELGDELHALTIWESGLKDILEGIAISKSKILAAGKQPILTSRQLATILHGLRIVQAEGRIEGCAAGDCEHFAELEPLTNDEINNLCEMLNIDMPVIAEEDEERYTNHYLCPNDNTRWDDDWSCMCNDRCPTCDAEIEPYASTDNKDGAEVIHCQEVRDKANGIEGEAPKA